MKPTRDNPKAVNTNALNTIDRLQADNKYLESTLDSIAQGVKDPANFAQGALDKHERD